LQGFPGLEELNISNCRKLVDISALSCCTKLKKLVMWQPAIYANPSAAEREEEQALARRWQAYPRMRLFSASLSSLSSLEELYLGTSPAEVGSCKWITDIEFVRKLPCLRFFSLRGCDKVQDVAALAVCPSLLVVDLRQVSYRLERGGLHCLSSCPSLVRFILGQVFQRHL
jgi:hypothetical protein